jgi:hypothetical protein
MHARKASFLQPAIVFLMKSAGAAHPFPASASEGAKVCVEMRKIPMGARLSISHEAWCRRAPDQDSFMIEMVSGSIAA